MRAFRAITTYKEIRVENATATNIVSGKHHVTVTACIETNYGDFCAFFSFLNGGCIKYHHSTNIFAAIIWTFLLFLC